MPSLSHWDWLLLLLVTGQGTLLAYLHNPRLKMLVFALPVPGTMVCLALEKPIGPAHVAGLLLLLLYARLVFWLHARWRLPIVPSIGLGVGAYVGLGALLAPRLPDGPVAFAVAGLVVAAVGGGGWWWVAKPMSPGQRSALPVWAKAPLVAAVVLLLILLKSTLQGFSAVFPMLGVITAYEMRDCLDHFARQIFVFLVFLVPFFAVAYLTQELLGMPGALALSWGGYLGLLALCGQLRLGDRGRC